MVSMALGISACTFSKMTASIMLSVLPEEFCTAKTFVRESSEYLCEKTLSKSAHQIQTQYGFHMFLSVVLLHTPLYQTDHQQPTHCRSPRYQVTWHILRWNNQTTGGPEVGKMMRLYGVWFIILVQCSSEHLGTKALTSMFRLLSKRMW